MNDYELRRRMIIPDPPVITFDPPRKCVICGEMFEPCRETAAVCVNCLDAEIEDYHNP